MAEDKFLNPYNFIGFPPTKAAAYTDKDRHTGVIEYTIETRTPLFIPNSSSESAFKESGVKDHKSYDFFSYTELDPGQTYENRYHVPVIPGSEIRGVIRNVYETLTDSCMGLLNEEEYPVKRSFERFSPALLCRENGKIVLYKANSLRVGERASGNRAPKGFEDCRNGEEIYFEKPLENTKNRSGYNSRNVTGIVTRYEKKPGKFKNKGYLIKWGMGVKKRRYHLFIPNYGRVNEVSFSRDQVERNLLSVIHSYLDQPALKKEDEEAYKEYKEDLLNFLSGSGHYFPVCYSFLSSNIVYLAPAMFSKEVSGSSIGELAGDFAPCKDNFCPACDLFGHIGRDNASSRGSRIRFTDLYPTEDREPKDYYLCDKITLPALGGPKTGNVDFYLKKPKDASFWTYDYYVKDGKLVISPGKLRGRKYYWHHSSVDLKSTEPTNLNKTVRPVKAGVAFSGKLYFEGISKKQLEQLIWILNSGSEKLGLKLGAAKPFGLGSISCTSDNVLERKISLVDDRLDYSVEKFFSEKTTYENVGFSRNVKREFYKIAGLNSVSKNVQITYPKTYEQKDEELKEGYKWFVNNHTTVSGKSMPKNRTDVEIIHALPGILDKETGLPYKNNFVYKGRR